MERAKAEESSVSDSCKHLESLWKLKKRPDRVQKTKPAVKKPKDGTFALRCSQKFGSEDEYVPISASSKKRRVVDDSVLADRKRVKLYEDSTPEAPAYDVAALNRTGDHLTTIAHQAVEIAELKKALGLALSANVELSDKNKAQDAIISDLNNTVAIQKSEAVKLAGEVESHKKSIVKLTNKTKARNATISTINCTVANLQSEKEQLTYQVEAQNNSIVDFSSKIDTQDATISALNNTIHSTESERSALSNLVGARNDTIAGLSEKISNQDATITGLNSTVANLEWEKAELAQNNHSLAQMSEDRGNTISHQAEMLEKAQLANSELSDQVKRLRKAFNREIDEHKEKMQKHFDEQVALAIAQHPQAMENEEAIDPDDDSAVSLGGEEMSEDAGGNRLNDGAVANQSATASIAGFSAADIEDPKMLKYDTVFARTGAEKIRLACGAEILWNDEETTAHYRLPRRQGFVDDRTVHFLDNGADYVTVNVSEDRVLYDRDLNAHEARNANTIEASVMASLPEAHLEAAAHCLSPDQYSVFENLYRRIDPTLGTGDCDLKKMDPMSWDIAIGTICAKPRFLNACNFFMDGWDRVSLWPAYFTTKRTWLLTKFYDTQEQVEEEERREAARMNNATKRLGIKSKRDKAQETQPVNDAIGAMFGTAHLKAQ